MKPEVDCPSLDLLYTETRDLAVRQLSNIEHINTKISIVIGLDGVLIVAILGALTSIDLTATKIVSVWQPWLMPSVISCGGVLALASMICAVLGFTPRTYKEILNPETTYQKYGGFPESEVKLKLLHALFDSYEKNSETIDGNLRWFRISLWLVVASLIAIAIAVGLYLIAVV